LTPFPNEATLSGIRITTALHENTRHINSLSSSQEKKMNTMSKALVAALVLGGSISTATAGGIITNITATDTSGGTFDSGVIGDHTLDLAKTFSSINPISLTFTVAHQDNTGGNPYAVTEAVTNNTGQSWTDFHYSITEPNQGNGVVFTANNQSTFSDFTLSSHGPRSLNFIGNLAAGGVADAAFNLSPFDPGAGNTSTFTLTQVPTIPEPETYAMLIAGLLLMGGMVKRRNNNRQV
jgi:hypothetical protein